MPSMATPIFTVPGHAWWNSAELLGRVLWGEELGIEVDMQAWIHVQ